MKMISKIMGYQQTLFDGDTLFRNATREFDAAIATDHLRLITSVLNRQGVTNWLHAGTMLGVVRDNALIPYDKDVDISCFVSQSEKVGRALRKLVKIHGFRMIRCYDNNQFVTIIKDRVYVDLYLYEEMDEGWFHICSDWQHESDLDLIEWDFLGFKVRVPRNYEQVLERWYGPTWRTPIKDKVAIPTERREVL